MRARVISKGQDARWSLWWTGAALGCLLLAFTAPSASALAPQIVSTAVSKVGSEAATLEARIDPRGENTFYRFEYGLSDCSKSLCVKTPVPDSQIPAVVSGTGDLTGISPGVSEAEARTVRNVVATAGSFGVGESISGTGIPAATTITAVNAAAKTLTLSKAATVTATGVSLTATGPQPVSVSIKGLAPGTVYHFLVVAHNALTVKGPDRIFATYTPPLMGLPDERAYEQSSPTEKDGGDVTGRVSLVKAAADGTGITFGSTFGIPGGKGAQALPLYLAKRGAGEEGWATQGLLPPASTGERAQVLGWAPDFSEVFSKATILGSPSVEAFFSQPTTGGEPTQITPYVKGANFAYAGASHDGSTVFFEAQAKLLPEAIKGASNLYAWSPDTKALHLVSVMNTESETKAALGKGGSAGPYDWADGINADSLRRGGAIGSYYLQDSRAVAEDGSVYFTAATTGQLYRRLNPAQPQSPLDGEGKCTDPALACTIHVSTSRKDDGDGPGGTDAAGPQPAAFQAASADGSVAFFTSPEKLTDDANTGPEQPLAAIVRETIDGDPENIENEFILKHAVGVAIEGSHVYWADPAAGTIGRADLDGNPGSVEPAFFAPGPTEYEVEEGVFEQVPSAPRYVAVEGEYLYWTNTGPLDKVESKPINEGGTIGRVKINPVSEEPEEEEPEFITGASNPQGIAVNSTHIYWANAATSNDLTFASIGRAAIGGGTVEQKFFFPGFSRVPYGVALSPTHAYFSADEPLNGRSFISRVPLEGGGEEGFLINPIAGVRGIALDSTNVYWASGEEETIGRVPLGKFEAGGCDAIEECEPEFIKLEGSPIGLAADSSHLYWSINGEAATNPGNDLYRFEATAEVGGQLTDLTPEEAGLSLNGAEVQGVLGASRDGSYLYFAANGVLAAGATTGDCQTIGTHGPLSSLKGHCNLYLWHEGQITYVSRLSTAGGETNSDALDWAPTPRGLFSGNGYAPKGAFVSEDGQTLLFRSQEKLTAYDNEGVPVLYRYRVGEPAIGCVSCNPAGEAPKGGPSLGSITFPGLLPSQGSFAVVSRTLSSDGNHAFFETAEALSPEDTNGAEECPPSGRAGQSFPACLDVYEWEALGTGNCKVGGPGYSAQNKSCLYLISTGKSKYPSLFADASSSGKDVFFFTREGLVGQDGDELQDVYDARVGGGLASQNRKAPPPCESVEACRPPVPSLPDEGTPATSTFQGPANPAPKHNKPKKKKKKQHKKQKRHAKHRQRAHSNRGAGR